MDFESPEAVVSVDVLQGPVRGSFNLRRFSGEAALVIGGAVVGNLFSYVFHFILSRRLGPDQYGTLATLMAIAAMGGVLGSSVGTVAMQETARMWASHLDLGIPPFLRRTGALVAGIAGLVSLALLVISVPLRIYLHVGSSLLWWLLALYVGIALFTGFARGAAQGAHRFGIFAASFASEGVGKVAISVGLVTLGLGVAGALGGLIASSLIAVIILVGPMIFGGERRAWSQGEHVRLGGETLKVLAVTATTTALLFIDMLFAKHHFSGEVAGYFGAAGTVARTIPYGVGFLGLILMPKAAAAMHTSRESLAHILLLTGGLAGIGVALGLTFVTVFGHQLIGITYGAAYTPAVAILHLYGFDEALFAIYGLAIAYLVAIARYEVFGILVAAVVAEAVAMAAFGSTPLRLLSIAIIVNALLVPIVWTLVLRTLREAPQARRPPNAEAVG